MKYAIDRIINNIVILENIKTKEKKEVPLTKFNFPIYDGKIIIYKNNKYLPAENE